jgi:hypothetical protein
MIDVFHSGFPLNERSSGYLNWIFRCFPRKPVSTFPEMHDQLLTAASLARSSRRRCGRRCFARTIQHWLPDPWALVSNHFQGPVYPVTRRPWCRVDAGIPFGEDRRKPSGSRSSRFRAMQS